MNTKELFNYAGNKNREIQDILPVLPPLDHILDVVEPFGGSFALTRHLYSTNPAITFTVNDIDNKIIAIYNTMKDPVQNMDTISKIKQIEQHVTKESFKDMCKAISVEHWLFCRLFGGFHGLYPAKPKTINYTNIQKFTDYQDILFTNEDGYDVIEKFKDNENTLIFLDPPYVGFCSRFYQQPLHYKLFDLLRNAKTWKCKMLLTIDDNILTRTFVEHFGLNIVKTVGVTYQYSKTKAKHIYITNY